MLKKWIACRRSLINRRQIQSAKRRPSPQEEPPCWVCSVCGVVAPYQYISFQLNQRKSTSFFSLSFFLSPLSLTLCVFPFFLIDAIQPYFQLYQNNTYRRDERSHLRETLENNKRFTKQRVWSARRRDTRIGNSIKPKLNLLNRYQLKARPRWHRTKKRYIFA